MKVRGWTGEWLELGLSKQEAVALRDLLGYIYDHPEYRHRARNGEPTTPPLNDAFVATDDAFDYDEFMQRLTTHLYRVVHARTRG